MFNAHNQHSAIYIHTQHTFTSISAFTYIHSTYIHTLTHAYSMNSHQHSQSCLLIYPTYIHSCFYASNHAHVDICTQQNINTLADLLGNTLTCKKYTDTVQPTLIQSCKHQFNLHSRQRYYKHSPHFTPSQSIQTHA